MSGTDPFAHDDAAYVLGALSPDARRAYEEHLGQCTDCARAVRDLAGLPGLLARVDEAVFLGAGEVLPVPDTMLPRLLSRVRRQRRRMRVRMVAGLVAAAAAVAVLAGLVGARLGGPEPAATTQPVTMTPVGQHALQATLTLQQVAWGTKMHLSCSEEDEPAGAEENQAYALVVRRAGGEAQQIATWRGLPGRTTELDAATALDPDQIARVDVVLVGTGRRVLSVSPATG
ncbi:MAG: zf-HC2 domain-containing protein [Nocardioides sp.]